MYFLIGILVIVIIIAITLMWLEKRIIELNNNICDTYREIDKDIDAIKSDCENINNIIIMLGSTINTIHNYIRDVDTTTNATLTIIKEINARVKRTRHFN